MKSNVGIYKIVNLDNGNLYVGSSHRLKQRKWEHFKLLEDGNHHSTHLQNSYNKYGKENFKWEIIEYIESSEDKLVLKENLIVREQYYLDLYESYNPEKGYNICCTAGSRLGSKASEKTLEKQRMAGKKNYTEETRKRLTEINRNREYTPMSEESKQKIKKARAKQIITEETKKKMSDSMKGKNTWMLGRKASEETKKKMSDSMKGKNRKPMSEETKEKLRKMGKENPSLGFKGRKHTEETKEKIRNSLKGHTPSNKGIPMSEEQKEKLRKFYKEKYPKA